MKQKIIVGLSGGVDSSVAALLLLENNYQVEAMFMKNWDEDDATGYCQAKQDLIDAKEVAHKLGIKLHEVNFATEYWNQVFSYFLKECKQGRTPNPDVLCNQKIKFNVFLEYALSLGADKIATGHYACIKEKNGIYNLQVGSDSNKDQSYFLYLLGQRQLAKSLFPLGYMNKTKVRQLASEHGIIIANKKDSTGICFIGKRNFKDFLQKYIKKQQGAIVDEHGRFIKHHQGLAFYTIGQRKGLQIGGGFDNQNKPWFVSDKRIDNNELVVVHGDSKLLYHNTLFASKIHWINKIPKTPIQCDAKIRYRQKLQNCIVKKHANKQLKVTFKNPQRAITPGQSVVFYQNNICLGGAIIQNRKNE